MSVIQQREEKEFERDWRQFVLTAVAMHPENSESILKLLDKDRESHPDEWAEPLTEDQVESYVPISLRPEKEDILRDLQELGALVLDD